MKKYIEFDSASDEVKKSLRLYFWIGIILFSGTAATVAVATIPFLDVGEHGFDKWDAWLGLMIASTKAALVAAIFMHLNHERRLIYGIIGLGAVHGIGLFIGTYMHFADLTHDSFFYDGEKTLFDKKETHEQSITAEQSTSARELR